MSAVSIDLFAGGLHHQKGLLLATKMLLQVLLPSAKDLSASNTSRDRRNRPGSLADQAGRVLSRLRTRTELQAVKRKGMATSRTMLKKTSQESSQGVAAKYPIQMLPPHKPPAWLLGIVEKGSSRISKCCIRLSSSKTIVAFDLYTMDLYFSGCCWFIYKLRKKDKQQN